MNSDQLLVEIQRCVDMEGITSVARALQTPISNLRKILKTGEIPPEIAARWADVEAERTAFYEKRTAEQLGPIDVERLLEDDDL